MNQQKEYIDTSQSCFSTIFGRGIYRWTEKKCSDPLDGCKDDPFLSPQDGENPRFTTIVENRLTGESFFLKRVDCTVEKEAHYRSLILAPPSDYQKGIQWPCDLVNLSEKQAAYCSLYLKNDYSDRLQVRQPVENSRPMALLFPINNVGYVSGPRKWNTIKKFGWKNSDVQSMAVGIVKALDALNQGGYALEDMHLSRFTFFENGQAMICFSNLIFSFEEMDQNAEAYNAELCAPLAGDYPSEFADPAYVNQRISSLDYHSQNHSLCALLFYLFFARHPYDGSLISGNPDRDLLEHIEKFEKYHENIIFIFDPSDDKNSPGKTSEDELLIDSWNELPDVLKELFIETLKKSNAERQNGGSVCSPTPMTWLRCFRDVGWCD